jgi:hypothetical protein
MVAPDSNALQQLRQVGAKLHVDHTIHFFAVGEIEYLLTPTRLTMIHHPVCPGSLASGGVGFIARRGYHTCAPVTRPLDRIVADATGTPGHQDPLIGDGAVGEHTAV